MFARLVVSVCGLKGFCQIRRPRRFAAHIPYLTTNGEGLFVAIDRSLPILERGVIKP